MNLKTRLNKLETRLGGQSGKHYLWIVAEPGESKDEAIDRYFQQHPLTFEEVGCLWVLGDFGLEKRDRGGYDRLEDLIGYREFQDSLHQIMDEIDAQMAADPLGIQLQP